MSIWVSAAGPGGGYAHFAGTDGSKSFITGAAARGVFTFGLIIINQ